MAILESIRIDKWLWAARFHKTRAQAAEAIRGGKVHLNGARVKPSKEVRLGDELVITLHEYTWEVTVAGLNQYRRPAPEAKLLYHESEASQEKRQAVMEERKIMNASFGWSNQRKPNKRQRRKIVSFKKQY